VVTTTADSGPGSLRDALNQVNADTSHALYASPSNPSVDEIDFAVTAASDTGGGFNAGNGVATITPQSPLPFITNAVTIDGWTQPTFAGTPRIELNGSQAGIASGLEIDSTNDTMSVTLRGLDINSFSGNGLLLYNRYTNSGNDVVEGCYLGTDVSGTARMPNAGSGIVVYTSSNRIGTNDDGVNDAAEGNLISGNNLRGLDLGGSGATGNVIAGNKIGTDVTGTQALANGGGGVALIAGPSNNIIGTSGHDSDNAGERNVISGNSLNFTDGILVNAGCSNNVIAGNYIGTDVTGMHRLSNGASGISVGGDHTFIGTDANGVASAATRNVISGNVFVGVGIGSASAHDNVVAGNYIGTDATGTAALGNTHGVWISDGATNNTVGGTTAAARNIISANGNGNGPVEVGLFHQGTSGNVVEGNYIGTDVNGSALGGATGVFIQDTSNNTIGGVVPGAGNLIAGTTGLGGVVLVQDTGSTTSGDSILGNSIHDNAGGGIVLGSGANNNQAAPLLTAAQSGLGITVVTGTVTSVPSATIRVEFFANAPGDAEGRTLLGSQSVTTDAAGNGSFTAALAAALPAGQGLVTATVTDPNGNTSAFSASVVGTALPPASLSGVVWEDFNNDGQVDFGESGIDGVTITLTGTDFLGRSVNQTQQTSGGGAYSFPNLLPGNYSLTETQPAGSTQGIDSVGTAGGSVSAPDQFSVALGLGLNGLNYNYGEQPPAGSGVKHGQTAGIGFWNNKNGQALINSLNGGTGTQLGDWLAATLPNTFGIHAGSNNLTGKTNAEVAALFQQDFVMKGVKLDAQVLATALSVYATNATLDPTAVAANYGFTVSGDGAGTATVSVGSNGDAFGVANNTVLTLVDLLRATDAQAVNGVLYNGDTTRRNEANNVYSAVNQAGNI
jgi:hypothetical protein